MVKNIQAYKTLQTLVARLGSKTKTTITADELHSLVAAMSIEVGVCYSVYSLYSFGGGTVEALLSGPFKQKSSAHQFGERLDDENKERNQRRNETIKNVVDPGGTHTWNVSIVYEIRQLHYLKFGDIVFLSRYMFDDFLDESVLSSSHQYCVTDGFYENGERRNTTLPLGLAH